MLIEEAVLGPLKHTIKDFILEDEEFIFIVRSGEKKEDIFISVTWINMMWLFLHYWNLNLTLFQCMKSQHYKCYQDIMFTALGYN